MIRFKYNGKIIETPNLLKKLKRLKITIDLIEIILTEDIKPKLKLIKELRHLDNTYEAIYENGLKVYYDNKDEIPCIIGDYKLINIRDFEKWSIDYIE